MNPEHRVQVQRTDNTDASVPPAFHATCECGWAAESHDEATITSLARAHEHGDHDIPAPAPASPSPVPS